MADRVSYATLELDKRHLKGMVTTATQAQGITSADLLDAERKAFDRMNDWILEVCGAKRGASFIEEWADDSSSVDRQVIELADLIASAYVWEWWERRNYRAAPAGETPAERQSDRLQEEALKLARSIERSGKTLKPDRTVRRWRYGALEQGPIVGGEMAHGSLFSDSGTYTDPRLGTFRLPHRHPLQDAT